MHLLTQLAGFVLGTALFAYGLTCGILGLGGHPLGPSPIAFVLAAPQVIAHPLFLWVWAGVVGVAAVVGLITWIRSAAERRA